MTNARNSAAYEMYQKCGFTEYCYRNLMKLMQICIKMICKIICHSVMINKIILFGNVTDIERRLYE
jgi:hypothetical protein